MIFFELVVFFNLYTGCLVQKGPLSSDTVVGQGSTSAWKMCGLDKATSLCLIFEIVKKEIPDATVQPTSNQFYFQFLT